MTCVAGIERSPSGGGGGRRKKRREESNGGTALSLRLARHKRRRCHLLSTSDPRAAEAEGEDADGLKAAGESPR